MRVFIHILNSVNTMRSGAMNRYMMIKVRLKYVTKLIEFCDRCFVVYIICIIGWHFACFNEVINNLRTFRETTLRSQRYCKVWTQNKFGVLVIIPMSCKILKKAAPFPSDQLGAVLLHLLKMQFTTKRRKHSSNVYKRESLDSWLAANTF